MIKLDLRYLPKRLRKKQEKLHKDLSAPLLRMAYPRHNIINELVSVQPLPDRSGTKAYLKVLMEDEE